MNAVHLGLTVGWALLGALLGAGIRWGSVRLAQREGLEPDHKPWQVCGPPLLNAVLFGLFAYHLGVQTLLLIHTLWVAVMVQIIFFDFEHRLILDVVQLPAMVAALLLSFVTPGLDWHQSLAAGIGAGLFFLLIALVGRLIYKTEAMGLGDVKLALLMGLILGIFPTLRAIFAGVILAGVIAVLLLALRLKTTKDPIAYGPYLAFGALIALYQQG